MREACNRSISGPRSNQCWPTLKRRLGPARHAPEWDRRKSRSLHPGRLQGVMWPRHGVVCCDAARASIICGDTSSAVPTIACFCRGGPSRMSGNRRKPAPKGEMIGVPIRSVARSNNPRTGRPDAEMDHDQNGGRFGDHGGRRSNWSLRTHWGAGPW